VAVSPRGHGDSDKPDDGYGIHDLAGDLVEFMDALGIDRATVVGHSGSSLVARRVAIDHPERVMGLVLEASPTLLSGDKARRFVESVVLELFDPIDEGFVEDFIGDTSSNLARDEFDLLVSETLKVPARVWHALFSELMDYDDIDNLTNISPPTLLIWGDADPLVDREMQDHLTQRIPNSELRVYPGLGHTPRWEDPDRFAADLAAFVTGAHGSG
jgi:pimeloyl-ACP methyl ester carboxylesterase